MTTTQSVAAANPGQGRAPAANALGLLGTAWRAATISVHTGVAATRWGGRYVMARTLGEQSAGQRLLGEELCSLLERLGPAFVKVGQVLSARPDLLPPAVAAPLARLQADVRRIPPGVTKRVVEAYLQDVGTSTFSSFDMTPVAAGSVAQVHRATLADDETPVAVKIRRPRANATVHRDLALLARMAMLIEATPAGRDMPLRAITDEISTAVAAQLDFQREALNMRRFQQMFRLTERVRIPQVYDDLCREGVIVMEYFDDLQRIEARHLTTTQSTDTALAGLRALYHMIFEEGFVHADMHPGNVFLRAGGELVVLDAGLVAVLSAKDQRDFVDFFFGLANDEGEECARIVWETALGRPDDDPEAWPTFRREMVELVARYARLASKDFEIARFVYDLIELQRRSHIRGSTAFIMTVLSMVVYDGICKALYPECDFQKEARGYLIHARYRLTGDEVGGRVNPNFG